MGQSTSHRVVHEVADVSGEVVTKCGIHSTAHSAAGVKASSIAEVSQTSKRAVSSGNSGSGVAIGNAIGKWVVPSF